MYAKGFQAGRNEDNGLSRVSSDFKLTGPLGVNNFGESKKKIKLEYFFVRHPIRGIGYLLPLHLVHAGVASPLSGGIHGVGDTCLERRRE